jgi:hypothetical protein
MSVYEANPQDQDAAAILISAPEQVRAAAAAWLPGRPLPLPAGDMVERHRRLLAAGGTWPAPAADRRPGVVLSTESADAEAAAHVLATATCRPHHHVPLAALADELRRHAGGPVALVGLADDLERFGDWPGMLAPRLGVLTGRGPASLYWLIYRTLTTHAWPASRDLLVSHPFQSDAAEADAVALDELEELVREPSRRLVVRSFGRECCVNLPDGVICGRSAPPEQVTAAAEGDRVPSCLRGGGCFRTDLDPEQRLTASDIDAQMVFLHTCSSIAVGNQVFPAAVNLGVGFLSGTAVAVIGAVGVHAAHEELRHVFQRAHAEGLALGDILERMNRTSEKLHGDMGRFGLLGDPAVVLPAPRRPETPPGRDVPGPRSGSTAVPGGREAAPHLTAVPRPEALRPGTPVADPAALGRLRHWHGVVLPGLLRLRWLDVPVDEARLRDLSARVREAAAAQFSAAPGEAAALVEAELSTVHGEILAGLVEHAHSSWWDFTDSVLPALRQEDSRPCDCPGCGRPIATAIRYAHQVDDALSIRVVRCRRCGLVRQSTGGPDTPRVVCAGLLRGRRGTVPEFTATLVNPGPRDGHGAVGHAFLAGEHSGMPVGDSRPLDVPAGRQHEFALAVDLRGTAARPHEHELAVFALYGKDLTVTTAWLALLPR